MARAAMGYHRVARAVYFVNRRFLPFLDHIDLYWQHQNDPEPHFERFNDLGFDDAYRKEIGDFVRWVTERRCDICAGPG